LEKKTFLFLGAIRGYKGIPALISAFTRTATGDEVLIIAGKPLNEKIKTEIFQLAAKRDDIFFFPEFVAECDIQTYLNTADAVVFPFRDIFTSGSALLAMSFSKALIVPDLESVAEIIMAGGAIPYDPHDETGLANALAAARSTDLQKLGRNNYEAAQNISWNSIAGQTLELYRGTLLGSTYIP
jgi:glycosyltransferase involved in cell wall biosynthesis